MKHTGFFVYLSTVTLCSLMGAALLAPAVRAGSANTQTPPNPMAAKDVQQGQQLFNSSCAFCHGATAKGSATGVSLVDSSLVRHDKGGDLITPIVQNGRVSKGMPAFPIYDAAQIADIAAFLHARIAITDSVETSGPRGGYELQHLLTGNAAAGKAFFEGPGGCTKCHSSTGDLAGIAKKYQPTELESRFLYPSDTVSTATVTLSSGKIISGALQHLDPFYVAIVDHEGHYHSWSLPGPKVVVHNPLQAHIALLGRYTNKDVHDVFAYLETLQ